MKPNRVLVYNAEDEARQITETFKARKVRERRVLPGNWPRYMQNVGENVRIDYDSDKWKKIGDFEQYAHVAESRNWCFVKPGWLAPFESPTKKFPVHGPIVDFAGVPMPEHVSYLANFLGVNLRLHEPGPPGEMPVVGDRYVHVQTKHGLLLGGSIQWSRVGEGRNQPFVAVYTEQDGIVCFIIGKSFSIEKDGLTG